MLSSEAVRDLAAAFARDRQTDRQRHDTSLGPGPTDAQGITKIRTKLDLHFACVSFVTLTLFLEILGQLYL